MSQTASLDIISNMITLVLDRKKNTSNSKILASITSTKWCWPLYQVYGRRRRLQVLKLVNTVQSRVCNCARRPLRLVPAPAENKAGLCMFVLGRGATGGKRERLMRHQNMVTKSLWKKVSLENHDTRMTAVLLVISSDSETPLLLW